MNVSIWDKSNQHWIAIKNVRYVVQLDNDSFKLDGRLYYTDRYELNLIHAEGGN